MNDLHGQPGWKEFLRNRKDILEHLDSIREQAERRPVKAAHGLALEARIRRWLTEFLPRKYGITSGYIVPTLYELSKSPLFHFDLIIFDQIESPILWTEGNDDQSEQGKHRAIPARNVLAVYEIKARLTSKTANDAVDKLSQLSCMVQQLHKNFHCGMIFGDLAKSDCHSRTILPKLWKGLAIARCSGGMVLRTEVDPTCTGIIRYPTLENPLEAAPDPKLPLAQDLEDLDFYSNEDGSVACSGPGTGMRIAAVGKDAYAIAKTYSVSHRGNGQQVDLTWARGNFASFCVDLLGQLDGVPLKERIALSFGAVFDSFAPRLSTLQACEAQSELPFLEIGLASQSIAADMYSVNNAGDELVLTLKLIISNAGADAVLCNDGFNGHTELPNNSSVDYLKKFPLKNGKPGFSLIDVMKTGEVDLPLRVVYKDEKGRFYYLEKSVRLRSGALFLI